MEESMKQLPLPLEENKAEQTEEEAPAQSKPVRRPKQGFMRVLRDSEVARSYSDNVALGYAVAKGLAQVLASMAPAVLAAHRAWVAQSAERTGKKPPAERSSLGGSLQEG